MDSYDSWRKVINDQIGKVETLNDLENAMLFVGKLNCKDSSKGMYKSVLKKMWWENHDYNKNNFADLEWEMKQHNFKKTKSYKKQHLDTNDISNILKACKSNKQILFINFLAKTGLRISEMINIKTVDCRINGKGVDISVKTAKTGSMVYKKISFDLYNRILKEFDSNVYLFETKPKYDNMGGNKKYRPEYISNQIKKVGRRAYHRCYVSSQIAKVGEKAGYDISAHSLRHYYVTNRINNNDDLLEISRDIGHLQPGSILNNYYTGKT